MPGIAVKDELPEGSLEPLRGAVSGSGEVSSGPSDTMAQIPISTQDQMSVTSNPIVTAPQSPGNPVIDNTVTQSTSSILQLASSSSSLAVTVIPLPSNPVALSTRASSIPLTAVPDLSGNPLTLSLNSIFQRTSSSSTSAVVTTQIPSTSSSSTLAPVVTQLCNNALSQSPSSINHQSSSSFNNDGLPTQLRQLPFNTVTHNTSSVGYQSSPSSSLNSNPSHILPSDSMHTNHPPAQIFPATTLAVIAGLLATQTIISGGTASSAVGLANATLTGIGIVPPGASATPDEVANSAIGNRGTGVEVLQIFPTTTLIVSIVSSVPTAAISNVQGGPVVEISASMGIIAPGTSAMQHGGVNGSSVITGGGSATGSDGAATGSGNPTETASGHTNVSTVFTGGAEGTKFWENWWLELGILVGGFGVVFWM